MQYRSKSAQQKNIERDYYHLNKKLSWVLNQCHLPYPHHQDRHSGSPQTQPNKFQPSNLRQILTKVDSFQKVWLVKKKTAIEELQQLVTPQEEEGRREEWREEKERRNVEIQLASFELENEVALVGNEGQKILFQQNQTVKYYKLQNNKLKCELQAEKAKSKEYLFLIKKLENSNSQLQRQVSLLLNKHQVANAHSSKVKELENSFKQQLIVNLELEELLLKKNLKIKEGANRHQIDEERLKKVLNEVSQFKEKKKIADWEIKTLKETIILKDQEIKKLIKQINKGEDQIQQAPITLHEIENPNNSLSKESKYIQRFQHFSKDMELKLQGKQIFVSTDPSLQEVTTMDNQNIRKNSGSQIFKGNYCSLSLCIGQSKANKPASKTDRL